MNTPHSTPEDGLSEDELLTTLRAAAPNVPAGLSERVLAGVRAGALARLRFRDELERSARGVLLAAAACLALCGALFLGQGGAGAPATADGRPSRAGSGSLAPRNSPAERSDPRWDASQGPTQGSPHPRLNCVDRRQ